MKALFELLISILGLWFFRSRITQLWGTLDNHRPILESLAYLGWFLSLMLSAASMLEVIVWLLQ